jgi:uncharacterized membrane protein YbhN (UPF0104 family)
LRLLSAVLVALLVILPILAAVALYRWFNGAPPQLWSAPHLLAVGTIMLVALAGSLLGAHFERSD